MMPLHLDPDTGAQHFVLSGMICVQTISLEKNAVYLYVLARQLSGIARSLYAG